MTREKRRLALDIETVSPDIAYDERPDFDNSRDFEISLITVGYKDPTTGDLESEVFFRNGWGPGSELDIIEAALKRIVSYAPEVVITYNGEAFDFHHLLGRTQLAAKALGSRKEVHSKVKKFIRQIESDDLVHDAWSAFGKYTSLEEACDRADVKISEVRWREYDHGIDPNEHRVPHDQGTSGLLSTDVAELGEIYLNWSDKESNIQQFTELEEMLRQYALADVEPLFDLADERPFANINRS